MGSGGAAMSPPIPPWDDTELMDVAMERMLALPDDLELVVDTERRVLALDRWPLLALSLIHI